MKELSVSQAHQMIQENEVLLIDVREDEEFEAAHIAGTAHVPLSQLPFRISEIDFDNYKEKPIIFYCLKGGRSAQAIQFLSSNLLQGYDLYNMTGGIKEWAEQDLPIVTPTEAK